MIQTWIADVTGLHQQDVYMQYYKNLPLFRQRKADRLQRQEDRALSVGAWALLQKMREEFKLSEDAVYNLSHSGTYVLCSVAAEDDRKRKLGCDLERIGSSRMNVAERFFCASEYATIQACEGQAQADQFYRLWVLKESFMKATRMGMKLDMKSYEVAFTRDDKPYLKRQPEVFSEAYHFKEYEIEGVPYRICVCADSEDFARKIRMVWM